MSGKPLRRSYVIGVGSQQVRCLSRRPHWRNSLCGLRTVIEAWRLMMTEGNETVLVCDKCEGVYACTCKVDALERMHEEKCAQKTQLEVHQVKLLERIEELEANDLVESQLKEIQKLNDRIEELERKNALLKLGLYRIIQARPGNPTRMREIAEEVLLNAGYELPIESAFRKAIERGDMNPEGDLE
jgi:hypothetical protein